MEIKEFVVKNTFKTIGDECRVHYMTREEAEKAMVNFRFNTALMVSEWIKPEEDTNTGNSNEVEAWKHARELSKNNKTYSMTAAVYIAEQAIIIEEPPAPEMFGHP